MASRATASSTSSSRIPAKRPAVAVPDAAIKRRLQKPLEAQAASISKTSAERRMIAAEEAQRNLEARLAKEKATISSLESDRRWLSEREAHEKQERERLEEAWNAEREELTTTNRTLRQQNLSLELSLGDLREAHSKLKYNAESVSASQRGAVASADARASFLQTELEVANQTIQHQLLKLQQLQQEVDELEETRGAQPSANVSMVMGENMDSTGDMSIISDVSATFEGLDRSQWGVVKNELTTQTERLKSTARENARLKAEVTRLRERERNVEVLREEKRDLERRLVGMEEALERAAMAEGELEAARAELAAWTTFINDPSAQPTSSTPTALTETLLSLRATNASLTSEVSALRSSLNTSQSELEAAQSSAAASQTQLSRLEMRVKASDKVNRNQRQRIIMLEEELRGTKAEMATYDKEAKAWRVRALIGAAGVDEKVLDEEERTSRQKRIVELERTIRDYKSSNDELQRQVAELLISSANAPAPLAGEDVDMKDGTIAIAENQHAKAQLESELAQATAQISTLTSSVQALEQQLWEAGVATGLGKLTPRETSIVHVQANPAAEHFALRRQELDRLKEENALLVERLRVVGTDEDGGVPEEGKLVPWKSLDNARKEVSDLKATLAQKDLRLLRLQQVFRSKGSEFRDAISSILGWKYNFQSSRVRLTLSADQTVSMVFDSIGTDLGTMKFLSMGDNPSSAGAGGEGERGRIPQVKIDSLLNSWVTQRNNIPCFLASLVLASFQAQDRERKAIAAAAAEAPAAMDASMDLGTSRS
ncbi:hypothetical protein DL93DRAFT_2082040 [Clavulina sp. PMI_390]|nr:hypothetical protein DL93DRAFT_2082040 [Clavulina sp. PMI_390]